MLGSNFSSHKGHFPYILPQNPQCWKKIVRTVIHIVFLKTFVLLLFTKLLEALLSENLLAST
jgi:hypothetical protein